MTTHKNRIVYGFFTISILLLGLASRRFPGDVSFVKDYVGDVLWALMIYLGLATVFNRWQTSTIAFITILFSFSIEVSQLYHAPWIDNLRATRFGGLVLGFTFVWSDLLCYSIGVGIGLLIETYLMPTLQRAQPKAKL